MFTIFIMIFTDLEIQRLLEIVDYHASFIAGNTLGKEILTEYDKYILNKHGINPDKILSGRDTTYYHQYLFGRLAIELGEKQAGQVTYENFKKYIERGQYVPPTKNEQTQIDLARRKTYGHIKGLGEKLKSDVNNTIIGKSREQYENIISKEIERGVIERKTVSSIVLEIGNKAETWNRDWGRIVETEYNNIFQQGRAEQILKEKGAETLVYKDTYTGACRFCIKLHTNGGIGTEPRKYKLSEAIANGSNIGRKPENWLFTIDSVHPFCRCNLREVPKGYKWNEETKGFEIDKNRELEIKRTAKVKVMVGDQVFWK